MLRADPLIAFRDTVADQVKVTIGDHIFGTRFPDQMATIELNWFATATVDAERPDAAVVSGRATVHAGTDRGEFRCPSGISHLGRRRRHHGRGEPCGRPAGLTPVGDLTQGCLVRVPGGPRQHPP